MAVKPASKVLRTRVFDIAEERGIKLTWLASQYGISPERLSRIRSGEQPISRKFIEKSCEIFALPLSALFFVEDVRDITVVAS